jgi:hypothetical protein
MVWACTHGCLRCQLVSPLLHAAGHCQPWQQQLMSDPAGCLVTPGQDACVQGSGFNKASAAQPIWCANKPADPAGLTCLGRALAAHGPAVAPTVWCLALGPPLSRACRQVHAPALILVRVHLAGLPGPACQLCGAPVMRCGTQVLVHKPTGKTWRG